MARKVVENWLTSTNERAYQIPYCQLLSSQGYRVIQVSSHGAAEHGKDIVAWAPDGRLCAYQLKTGNIKVPEWRTYAEEIREMTDIKCHHPSVKNESGWHDSYLVTNGRVGKEVQDKIDLLNTDHKGQRSHLHIVQLDELLDGFEKLHGGYFPIELEDNRLFLQLYMSDGHEPLPNASLSRLLVGLLPLSDGDRKIAKSKCRALLASALLVVSYISENYSRAENHFALIDLWTIFLAHTLAVAEYHSLLDDRWMGTCELAVLALETAFEDATAEVERRTSGLHDLVEGDSLTDFAFFRQRGLVIAGYLSAFALSRKIRGVQDWRSRPLDAFIERFGEAFLRFGRDYPYGEWSLPLILSVATYIDCEGRSTEAAGLVEAAIIAFLGAQGGGGWPVAYYDRQQCVRSQMGIEILDESFRNRSSAWRPPPGTSQLLGHPSPPPSISAHVPCCWFPETCPSPRP